MASQQVTLRDPSRFKDPAGLTWERYVALQARERERYLAERATIPADALQFQTVSPRYLERAVEQFARLRLIATLHDPAVIRKILAHLGRSPTGQGPGPAPPLSAAAVP